MYIGKTLINFMINKIIKEHSPLHLTQFSVFIKRMKQFKIFYIIDDNAIVIVALSLNNISISYLDSLVIKILIIFNFI